MLEDVDPGETQEWVGARDPVLAYEGAERASHLLDEIVAEARRKGAPVPYSATTPYLDTIPPGKEERHPGDRGVGADAAGVIVDDRGFIPVDEQMRTNVGHVFAIGDVVCQPVLAHEATHDGGRVAAEAAAGQPSRSGGTRA